MFFSFINLICSIAPNLPRSSSISSRVTSSGQIPKEHVSRCTILLHCEHDRCRDGRRLSPADFDLLSTDSELSHSCIGVENLSRWNIEERDECAILLRKNADRFDWTGANIVQDFFGESLRRNIPEIHRSTSLSARDAGNKWIRD